MLNECASDEYDQGTDLALLAKLFGFLANRSVIDVGAERGTFVRVLVDAGAEAIYAFEPFPKSVHSLKSAFAETPAVKIFQVAIGDRDDEATLYVVEDKTALHEDAFHSLVSFDETPMLRCIGEIRVRRRSLASLVNEGLIPSEIGVLKVDTERSDFAVLKGMGPLRCDIVVIEFWDDLAGTVGPAAYRIDEVASYMADRGYTNYVVIKRHGEFETLQVNDGTTRPGDWGNVIFMHDDAYPRLSVAMFAEVSAAQQRLIDRAQFFAGEAAKRLDVIERDEAAVAASRDVHAQLARQVQEKETVIVQLAATALERLQLMESANDQASRARDAQKQLVDQILDRDRLIADLTATAEERSRLLGLSTAEADEMRAQVARLDAELSERGRVIDELTAAANERLRHLVEATAEIDRLRQTMDGTQSDISAALEEVRRKDRLIDELTEAAEERLRLLKASTAEVGETRAELERLNADLAERARVIDELAEAAKERLRLLDAATAECDRLRLIVAGHPDDIAAIYNDIQQKEQLIAELLATAEERLELVRRLTVDFAARDEVIVRLTTELENKERVIVGLADAAERRLRLLEQSIPNPTGYYPG